jgi:hypothetical protein
MQQSGAPGPPIVLGALAVPPAHLARAVRAGSRPWAYFRKYGLVIRADSPAVLVTVPQAWRRRVAISWGNNVGAVSSLRILSCPPQPGLGSWNGYPGGFWLRSAVGCAPVRFQVGRRAVTLLFAIGRRCSSAA